MRATLVVSLFLACPSLAFGGILVDHPALKLAASTGVSIVDARMYVNELEFDACDDSGAQVVSVQAEMDLLAEEEIPVPEGSWCGMRIVSDDVLSVAGVDELGEAFALDIPVTTVDLGIEQATSSGSSGVVRLGASNWLNAQTIDEHLLLDAQGYADASSLAEAVALDSTVTVP